MTRTASIYRSLALRADTEAFRRELFIHVIQSATRALVRSFS